MYANIVVAYLFFTVNVQTGLLHSIRVGPVSYTHLDVYKRQVVLPYMVPYFKATLYQLRKILYVTVLG